MNEPRRRFQFSLRRMLLWTAVVAVCCNILKILNLELGVWFLLIVWMIVVGVLLVIGCPKWAACWSIIIGIPTGWFTVLHFPRSELSLPLIIGSLIGVLFGVGIFVIVRFVLLAVNWADNFIDEKTTRHD